MYRDIVQGKVAAGFSWTVEINLNLHFFHICIATYWTTYHLKNVFARNVLKIEKNLFLKTNLQFFMTFCSM